MTTYHVYIMASRSHALYTGATSRIGHRVAQHRAGYFTRAHSAFYRNHRLVYFEECRSWPAALARERQIKGWIRARKIALIEAANPTWKDLAAYWVLPNVRPPNRAAPNDRRTS